MRNSRSYHLILSTRNDCKDFPIPNDNGTLHFDFPLRLPSHPAILLSERSRMDRPEEASRRTLKSIHAKFPSRWLSCNFKEHKDLPDERNDTNPGGKETGLISRKLDVLIEKCCIPCVCVLTTFKEPHIALTKVGESLQ